MTGPTPDELHSTLWRAIEHLGERCGHPDVPEVALTLEECCGMCDECQADLGGAQRALHQLIFRHRPDPIPTAPDGKTVYPGWAQVCHECQRRYPCSTVADVADGLGVDWVQRLVS